MKHKSRGAIVDDDNEKRTNAKKYFLTKISDYIDNKHNMISKKRHDSLELYLHVCILTYEEMVNSGNSQQLKSALKSLLDSLKTIIEHHPYNRSEQLKTDLKTIKTLIETKDNNGAYSALNIGMQALYKKISKSSLLEYYLPIIKITGCFQEMDILLASLISDLLYRGYSLFSIRDWYKKHIRDNNAMFVKDMNENNVEPYIESLSEFDFEKKDIVVRRSLDKINRKTGEEIKSIIQRINSNKSDGNDIEIINTADNSIKMSFKVKAYDYYHAISVAQLQLTDITSDLELNPLIRIKGKLNKNYEIVNDETKTIDERTLHKNISIEDAADKWQTITFKEFTDIKYKSYNDTKLKSDIQIIESIFYTVINTHKYEHKYRLLNTWTAMEYLHYSYEEGSIIEKIRTIIPKLYCNYYIREKMNIFCDRLLSNYNSGKLIEKTDYLTEMLKECEIQGNQRYNVSNLIKHITENAVTLENSIKKHAILWRELCELNGLISNNDIAKKRIEEYHNLICADLNLIYRIRNIVAHSGMEMMDNIDYITLRLMSYINSLLTLILYYKSKNNDITIKEILYSIVETYKNYEVLINKDDIDKYKLTRPKYMFIE